MPWPKPTLLSRTLAGIVGAAIGALFGADFVMHGNLAVWQAIVVVGLPSLAAGIAAFVRGDAAIKAILGTDERRLR